MIVFTVVQVSIKYRDSSKFHYHPALIHTHNYTLYYHMHTMRPACNADIPANGTLFVPISHTIMAKLYILAALLSTSSGRFCRATENINMYM